MEYDIKHEWVIQRSKYPIATIVWDLATAVGDSLREKTDGLHRCVHAMSALVAQDWKLDNYNSHLLQT